MLTIDQVYDAVLAASERAKASDNTADLMELQLLAGYLMRPAEHVGDAATARRFQILASQLANAQEAIRRRHED